MAILRTRIAKKSCAGWADPGLRRAPRTVHGEPAAAQSLAAAIRERRGGPVSAAQHGEEIPLGFSAETSSNRGAW
jgi:hypothetical protein